MGEFHTLSCCDHVIVTWQEALFWVVPLNRSPEVCVRSTWGQSVGPQSAQCWEDTKNWGHPGPKVAGRISWSLHPSPSRLLCWEVTCSPTPGPNTCWAAASRPAWVDWARVFLGLVAAGALILIFFQVALSAWVPGQLVQKWQVRHPVPQLPLKPLIPELWLQN